MTSMSSPLGPDEYTIRWTQSLDGSGELALNVYIGGTLDMCR
jgi:hypothetical protein